MNKISPQVQIGTVGEMLVQLRLLQYGVQASSPVKDSGNDLIGIRRGVFRAIQVKTTTKDSYSKANLPNLYHILAVVHLVGNGDTIYLDRSRVFLIPKDELTAAPTSVNRLGRYLLKKELVEELFAD
jgi:hypothetical protein